jgi:hypothetical protein
VIKLLLPILLVLGLRWFWRKRGWKERFSRSIDLILMFLGAVYGSALALWGLGFDREEIPFLAVISGIGLLFGLEVLLRGIVYLREKRG